MSVKCGKIITCDRCGKSVFLNQTPFTTDGGYEPVPEDWKHGFDVDDLCPDCYGEYLKLKKSFLFNESIELSEFEKIILENADLQADCERQAQEINSLNAKIDKLHKLLNMAMDDLKCVANYDKCDYCMHDKEDKYHTSCTNYDKYRNCCTNFRWIHADEIEEVLNND